MCTCISVLLLQIIAFIFYNLLGFLFFFFFFHQNDQEPDVSALIQDTTTPRIICTGNLPCLTPAVIAAEGMAECSLNKHKIVTILTTLLAAYHTFNIAYSKGPSGHCQNVYLFLEYLLLGKSPLNMPLGVNKVVSLL